VPTQNELCKVTQIHHASPTIDTEAIHCHKSLKDTLRQ